MKRLAAALLACSLMLGCGGGDDNHAAVLGPTQGDGSTLCSPTSCPEGQWCDTGACVDCATDDPDHCGATCTQCTGTSTPLCVGGECVECDVDTDCDQGEWCFDSVCEGCADDDPDHCGGSCAKCAGTEKPLCAAGACAECALDTDCGGGSWCNTGACEACTDDDPAHCGSTCAVCADPTPICLAGTCAQCATIDDCAAGSWCDGGTCTECGMDDPDHCGTSCATCTGTQAPVCMQGTCGECTVHSECPPERPYCTNLLCGECVQDTHCETGNWCDAGTCVPCGDSDANHCGATCALCTGTPLPSCINGACAFCEFDTECPDGKWCSAGVCTTCGTTDPLHCGTTCARCEGTSLPWCSGGACSICSLDSHCPTGEWCSGGDCIPCSASDNNHCGPICAVCSGTTPTCSNTTCQCVRTSPTVDSCYSTGAWCNNGDCTGCTASDNDHCGDGFSKCAQCTGTATPWCVNAACKQCKPGTADCGAGKWCDAGGTCKTCTCAGANPVCSLADGSCSCTASSCLTNFWCDAGACKACSCPTSEPTCNKANGACACTSTSCPAGQWCDSADCQACSCPATTPLCTTGSDCKCTSTSCGTGARCGTTGACEACSTPQYCGPTCVTCSGTTPLCSGATGGCVCRAASGTTTDSCGAGKWCDATAGACQACTTTDNDHCGTSCAKCTGTANPVCVAGTCRQCGTSQHCAATVPWCVNNVCVASITPTYPVPPTEQTLCYDDATTLSCPSPGAAYYGQDAQYPDRVRAITLKELVKVNIAGGTRSTMGYTDEHTGVTWEGFIRTCVGTPVVCTDARVPQHTPSTWQQAADECGNLVIGTTSDWRLPNVYELRAIAQYDTSNPAVPIEFDDLIGPARYWTSTIGGLSTTQEWYVDFTNGSTGIGLRTSPYDLVCVRGTPWVPPGATRYQLNQYTAGQEIVADFATKLIWAKGSIGAGTWSQALAYCEGLTYSTFSDWRLPNVNELGSIFEAGISPASRMSGITGTTYWTSTSDAGANPQGWSIEFVDGAVLPKHKSDSASAMCVRGLP